jgi:mono/diheme cytochrome c family protein
LLGVSLFIAFWVVLAAGVFYFAGRRTDRQRREAGALSYRGSRALGVTMIVLYVAFGVAVPVLFLHGNHANASAQIGGIKLTANQKTGRELFGEHCGVCHTLSGANAVGKVGPNLDVLKPAQNTVLNTINNGCLPNPPKGSNEGCLGQGVMPAAVVQGSDAQDVASFVAKVAGNE